MLDVENESQSYEAQHPQAMVLFVGKYENLQKTLHTFALFDISEILTFQMSYLGQDRGVKISSDGEYQPL